MCIGMARVRVGVISLAVLLVGIDSSLGQVQPSVDLDFSPNVVTATAGQILQIDVIARSSIGVDVPLSGVGLNLQWDSAQLELQPVPIEGTYNWLVFDFTASGIQGVLNADLTDGDAFLEALAQFPPAAQPSATPTGFVIGTIEFLVVGGNAASQVTIPRSVNVSFNGQDIVWDTVVVPLSDAGVNVLDNTGMVQVLPDCNINGIDDALDISSATSKDCNGNQVPDECEIDSMSPAEGGPFFCSSNCDPDCNINGIPDSCDIASGQSSDCPPPFDNGIPDECESDCNCNGIDDATDLAMDPGLDVECGPNGVIDTCERDCDGDGMTDHCAIVGGALDSNGNGVPDSCELCADICADGTINVFDLFCMVDAFNDISTVGCSPSAPGVSCGPMTADIASASPVVSACEHDGVVTILDLFGLLNSLQGASQGNACCEGLSLARVVSGQSQRETRTTDQGGR